MGQIRAIINSVGPNLFKAKLYIACLSTPMPPISSIVTAPNY